MDHAAMLAPPPPGSDSSASPPGAARPLGRPAWAVAALGAAAVLGVLAAAGVCWKSAFAGLAMLVAASAVARHVVRCQEAAVEQVASAAAAERTRLLQFCRLAAPLWMRQIDTAREQGDGEIAELSRAFGDIVHRLEQSMGESFREGYSGRTTEAVAVLRRNAQDLLALVGTLKSLQARNGRIVGEVAGESSLLQDSASEIRQIALRTRVVAMNATIEAARAGAAGRAFSVIVNDMRDLALRTAEVSEQCTQRAQGLHGLVSSALSEGDDGEAAQQEGSIAWAQRLVEQVVERFRTTADGMHASMEKLEAEREEVRGDIARALVALQFQDRVSQILGHVREGIGRSCDDLQSGGVANLDEREWLQRIASDYSTPEEFRNLEGARGAARPDSGVTFF